VHGECDSADCCGPAHPAPCARRKRKTPNEPENPASHNKKRAQDSQFHRYPEPVALGVDRFAFGNKKVMVSREERPKVPKSGPEPGGNLEKIECVPLNQKPPIFGF